MCWSQFFWEVGKVICLGEDRWSQGFLCFPTWKGALLSADVARTSIVLWILGLSKGLFDREFRSSIWWNKSTGKFWISHQQTYSFVVIKCSSLRERLYIAAPSGRLGSSWWYSCHSIYTKKCHDPYMESSFTLMIHFVSCSLKGRGWTLFIWMNIHGDGVEVSPSLSL